MSDRSLESLQEIVDRPDDADEILRSVVARLATEPGITWAGIAFLDEGVLTLGPTAGAPDEATRRRAPIVFHDVRVGELRVDGDADDELLERAASMIAAHVLIGWDTGGKPWDP